MTTPPCSPHSLQDADISISKLKVYLDSFFTWQKEQFTAGKSVMELVPARSRFMDDFLSRLWHYYQLDKDDNISLLAVGGYGRAELHPLSDIDILFLTKKSPSKEQEETISDFLRLLWDIRLDVGHAVRTIKECITTGKKDLTIATNLQESRLIIGDPLLFQTLEDKILSDKFWTSEAFYRAKVQELHDRYAHYHDTTYNLEPDIKASPGGLRDIHTLSWVARRHFGATNLFEMSQFGFLTEGEYRELAENLEFLWKIRFALHLELRRYDNRLTFAHQPTVAERLGYQGEGNKAVETMMQDFFTTLQSVAELSKMLLQYFDQAILPSETESRQFILDDDFMRKGHFIEARKPALFQSRPETILDMFLHIADNDHLSAIGAQTLRQLRTARRRINLSLNSLPQAREKFMQLFRHPNVVSKAVGMMHRHGVFTLYFPEWENIVGRMQFDLFHAYTVDEHSIRALKKVNLLGTEEAIDRFPLCHNVYMQIQRKDLLFVAALFHDIGKGSGGDHSEIGAKISRAFCLEHGLSEPEANIVAFLVQNHLLLSMTAQKRDIHDPLVITEFAKRVQNEEQLKMLLCLTVGDICATNSELWNSWKRTLTTELFHATQKALRRGLETPPDIREKMRHNSSMAATLLRQKGFKDHQINQLWLRFKADYFLRNTHQQIAWHCEAILKHNKEIPLVLVGEKSERGGTEIFIYTKDKEKLFATVAAQLDRKNLNIYDAQIMEDRDDYTLDSFIVLEQNGKALDKQRRRDIQQTLEEALTTDTPILRVRRAPQKLKHFNVPVQVKFMQSKNEQNTQMELIALDTPGLLARLGLIFTELDLNLHSAKISTIGERAEDFFVLTGQDGSALSDEKQSLLEQRIKKKLTPDE